jgi:hypothetical protein
MIGVTAHFPQQIEIRHPYFDRRVVEMALSMPKEMKWDSEKRGWLAARLHHRQAMAGILPDQVRLCHSGVNFDSAYRAGTQSGVIRKWLDRNEVVHIFERGYVQPELFLKAVEDDPEPEQYLRVMICLEGWLRAVSPGGQMTQLIPARRSDQVYA